MATREEYPRAGAPIDRSIAQAKDGSFSALGQLLDQYRDYLLKVAAGELANDLFPKVSPSDVVQETFIQAVRGFPQFTGTDEAGLRAWLRQILLHNIRDAQKHWNRDKRRFTKERALEIPGESQEIAGQLPARESSASAALRGAEERDRLRVALARLSAEHRQVIELRTFQELPFDEVARVMSRSSDAARKLWSRAVDRLAELFADE